MITIKIMPTPERFDHIEIRFEINGVVCGFGYIGKANKKIGLTRCPICEKENYAPVVSTGECAWCYFNANDCQIEDQTPKTKATS